MCCIPLSVVISSMPPRKKMVTRILTSVGENHRLKPSIDHIFMHSKGTESSGGIAHRESREIMASIKDL